MLKSKMKLSHTKICFFGCDFPPTSGGIATYSYEWILTTAENLEVASVRAVIFGNKNPRREQIGKLGLITFKSRGFVVTGILTLIYILKNFNSDLFHSLNLFPVGFWVVFWSKILKRKSAVTFYGTDACSSQASILTLKLKKWTIENASRAFTISEFTKRETLQILKIQREIEVVYALVPEKTIKEQQKNSHLLANHSDSERIDERIHDEDFIVLSVCRMVKRKGLDLLLKAISLLGDDKIKAVLVGDGPERKVLEDMASELKIQDRVIFVGKVNSLEPYYKRANVAVLLSNYLRAEGDFEGLGLVLIEAQYYGVPVIGSESGGIPEAFENGRTGLLVPESNSEAIRDAILEIYNNKDLRNKMSQESKKFIYEKFDPKMIIDNYIKSI